MFQPGPLQGYVSSAIHRYTATRYRPAEKKERPLKVLPSQALCYYSRSQAVEPSILPAKTIRLKPDGLFVSIRIANGLDYNTACSPVTDDLRKIATRC